MTAQVIDFKSRTVRATGSGPKEWPKTARERAIEDHYLGIIARMGEELHKQTCRVRRLQRRRVGKGKE